MKSEGGGAMGPWGEDPEAILGAFTARTEAVEGRGEGACPVCSSIHDIIGKIAGYPVVVCPKVPKGTVYGINRKLYANDSIRMDSDSN